MSALPAGRQPSGQRPARAVPTLAPLPSPDWAAVLEALAEQLGARGLLLMGPPAGGGQSLAQWGVQPRGRAWQTNGQWLPHAVSAGGTTRGTLWIRAGDWQTRPAAEAVLAAALPLLAVLLAGQAELAREHEHYVLAQTFQGISQTLTSTLDLDEVLARILDELGHLVPYDSALVMLLEGDQLHLHAQRGYRRSRGEDLSRVVFSPETTPMLKEVLAAQQPLILPDIHQVPGWVWLKASRHIHAWMGVPLRIHDRVTGLFSIDKVEPGFFTEQHAALAAAVAPHAAIAIENARLFDQLRAAEDQLRGLSLRVIEAQEAERQWVGRELHDQAGQALLALRAELQILARQIPAEARAAHAQLAHMDEVLRVTGRDLRLLSHDLRSHLLDELGLSSALQQHLRDFAGRFGVQADLVLEEAANSRWPRPVELAAFRIAQEALTNVVRHAQASRVEVRLSLSQGRLCLSVRDDGCGFDPTAPPEGRRFGLVGMRERAASVGGRLRLTAHPGAGTQVFAEFPLETSPGQPGTEQATS